MYHVLLPGSRLAVATDKAAEPYLSFEVGWGGRNPPVQSCSSDQVTNLYTRLESLAITHVFCG